MFEIAWSNVPTVHGVLIEKVGMKIFVHERVGNSDSKFSKLTEHLINNVNIYSVCTARTKKPLEQCLHCNAAQKKIQIIWILIWTCFCSTYMHMLYILEIMTKHRIRRNTYLKWLCNLLTYYLILLAEV